MRPDESELEMLRRVSEKSRCAVSQPKKESSQTSQEAWMLPGLCGKSKIATSFGHLPIEALRRNDPVKTSDGQYMKVAWLKKIGLDSSFLAEHPEAQPIGIPKNCFGPSKPSSDLLMSPGQAIQILRPDGISTYKAGSLSQHAGVSHKPHSQITYYVFGCEKSCAVQVDGLWCFLEAEF